MQTFKKKSIQFFATGGLIGFSPVAPGTLGSLTAMPLCLFVSLLATEVAVFFVVVLTLVSTWIAHAAERMASQNDPNEVVIDEMCGMVVTLFALPFTPVFIIGGFALFRVFDIFKPFPIGWIDQKISGGVGIMLDDVIAGLIANLLLRLGRYLIN